MGYAIGIASGHRFTHALVLSGDQYAAFEEEDSAHFHNVAPSDVTSRLRRLLAKLAVKLDVREFDLANDDKNRIVLSVPGVSTVEDHKKGVNFLQAVGCENGGILRVVDDTSSGLVGGLLAERGICAFAGTGASVFFGHEGFRLGKPHKLDGYGAIIGDFGAGFRAAVRLLERIGRSYDANEPCPLFDKVREMAPGLESPRDLQQWFDSVYLGMNTGYWRQRVAALAQVVTEAADANPPDPTALEIVKQSAQEIAETITTGLKRFGTQCQNLAITCQGGMFRSSPLYLHEVQRIVGQQYPNPVRLALYHPVVGAALIARVAAESPPNPFPRNIERALPSRDATRCILQSLFEQPPDIIRKLAITATRTNLFGDG